MTPPDVVLYAPASSGIRVRILQSPSRHGNRLVCVAVFEGGPKRAPEAMASRIGNYLRAPSLQLAGTQVDRSTIFTPWAQRETLRAALESLFSVPAQHAPDTALRARIDRNSLAGLVSHGTGLWHHLMATQRKWRFCNFTLIETFGLLSITWAAVTQDDEGAEVDTLSGPCVVIQGGLNTLHERSRMAARLTQAADLAGPAWND